MSLILEIPGSTNVPPSHTVDSKIKPKTGEDKWPTTIRFCNDYPDYTIIIKKYEATNCEPGGRD